MTKSKKALVVAGAAALGLVAATGVTSGLAWFATNATVSVTGMAVSANTTDSFLLIKEGTHTGAELRTASASADLRSASISGTTSLMPVTYTGSTEAGELTTSAIETADQDTNTKYKWGTGTSTNVNDANTASAITKIAKGTGDAPIGTFAGDVAGAGKYVRLAEFSVALAAGSYQCDGLKISAVDIKNGAQTPADSTWSVTGLTLIVATSTTGYRYESTNASLSNQIWSSSLTSTGDSVTVKAYVYIDGKSAGVKTAAIDDLKGTIGFSITTVPHNPS